MIPKQILCISFISLSSSLMGSRELMFWWLSFRDWISLPSFSHVWHFTPQTGVNSFSCIFNSPITSGLFASKLKGFECYLRINNLVFYHIFFATALLVMLALYIQTLLANNRSGYCSLTPESLLCSFLSSTLGHVIIKLLNPNSRCDINFWSFEPHF